MGHIVDSYAVSYVEEKDSSVAAEILKKDASGKYAGVDPAAVANLAKDSPAAKLAAQAQSQGYRMAFRWVSLLPAVLIVIFSGVILYDRSRGGYKAEILISREEEDELFAGGVQGAVE